MDSHDVFRFCGGSIRLLLPKHESQPSLTYRGSAVAVDFGLR